MLARLGLATVLLTLGCSGTDNQTIFDPPTAQAGTGGIVVSGVGGSDSAGSAAEQQTQSTVAGAPAGGSGGVESSAGMGGAVSSSAGQAGATMGGASGGAAQVAGAGGVAQTGGGGAGGKAAGGGTGGQASDPLDPKPVPGCPGYVKVFVPHGTCVWFHGTFTHQTDACDLMNPAEGKCATASAISGDTSSIVSDSAEITRLAFDATGCPKQCN